LINLDKKRENEKLKELVMENLSLYIAHLEKLSEDLRKLKSKEAKEYIHEMQSVFNAFSKNSATSFERATILIGKELEEIKRIIPLFVKNFNDKIKSNNYIFEKLVLIDDLKQNLKELEYLKNIKRQSNVSTKTIQTTIISLETEKQKTEKELYDFKKSKKYSEFIEEQSKLKHENKILNEDIFNLKQKIDFRLLSKHFHNHPKKSKIISEYSEDFSDTLKKDNTFEIINLIKEANQQIDEQKLKQIQEKLVNKKIIKENETLSELENMPNRLEQDILNHKKDLEKEEEKITKFGEKEKAHILQIKGKIRKIWENLYLEVQQDL
jgi:hypothetical protein